MEMAKVEGAPLGFTQAPLPFILCSTAKDHSTTERQTLDAIQRIMSAGMLGHLLEQKLEEYSET